jgi:hypothetical protein
MADSPMARPDNEAQLLALGLEKVVLSVPPGSLVVMNSRLYHSVTGKPVDSPQPARLMLSSIYKLQGPTPHRHTAPAPRGFWLAEDGIVDPVRLG